jgi:hypothetical protein
LFGFQLTFLHLKLLCGMTTHLVAHVRSWQNDHRQDCYINFVEGYVDVFSCEVTLSLLSSLFACYTFPCPALLVLIY